MRITEIESIVADVPFHQPFVVWRGSVPVKRHVFVRVATDAGLTGWGEASPFLFYAPETAEGIHAAVTSFVASELMGRDPRDVRRAMAALAVIDGHLMTKAAVETALWDILGQSAGLPLYRLLGGAIRDAAPLTAILHAAAPTTMADEARAWVARGFDALKIKIGFGTATDVAMVAAVRAAVGPEPTIRVDAEEFYTPKQALEIGRQLEPCGIELISQPVARTNWAGMAFLRERLTVPLLADEGVHSPDDVATCARFAAADMVNIKVLKSGGILASMAMAAICAVHHLPVLVGSTIETGIGSLAAAHFAVAAPGVFSTELAGPLLFADDLLDRPLDIHDGAIWLDESAGLGRTIDRVRLERCRVA